MRTSVPVAAWLLLISLLAAAAPAAEIRPRIDMVLLLGENTQGGAAQKWLKILEGLKIDELGIQIRQPEGPEQPEILNLGTDDRPIYRVVGVLISADELVLRGGRFTSKDAARLKRYLETLQLDGIEGVTEGKSAFGMTEKHLQSIHDALSKPVRFATAGEQVKAAIEELREQLDVPLEVDRTAAAVLREAEPSEDEVRGLSAGTALAILLRPHGLALTPLRKRGGEPQLLIQPAAEGQETWPVGWEPQEKEQEVLPLLFEFLNVEIDGIELEQALEAIQKRLKIPFLYDHNAIALHRIDLTKEVTVPAGRTYYKRILTRILFQAKLKGELRVDELGQPFLWITSLKTRP